MLDLAMKHSRRRRHVIRQAAWAASIVSTLSGPVLGQERDEIVKLALASADHAAQAQHFFQNCGQPGIFEEADASWTPELF